MHPIPHSASINLNNMRVLVKNLPSNLSPDQLKREFQRAGRCTVEQHVKSTQDTFAYIDYLDIVNATEAIKLFHGKDFAGNKISVTKEFDCIVNLSQKRAREDSQTITLLPASRVVSFNSDKKTSFVYLGVKNSENTQKTSIDLNKNREIIHLPHSNEQGVKVMKVEGNENRGEKNAKVEEIKGKSEKNMESVQRPLDKEKTGQGNNEKTAKTEEQAVKVVKNGEVPVNSNEKQVKNSEGLGEPQSNVKDSLTIEIEGGKFLKTDDENKLHCISCNKEITRKAIKAHLATKAHKSLL